MNLTKEQYEEMVVRLERQRVFRETLPESKVDPKQQLSMNLFMGFFSVMIVVYQYIMNKHKKRQVIQARQKITKSSYAVYINEYDDIELDQKVKKV